MCPLCILSAIVLGGGTAVAGGLDWAKGKLFKSKDAGDGCLSLQLQGHRAPEESSGAVCKLAFKPGK